jgi:nitrogen regulatory protein PII
MTLKKLETIIQSFQANHAETTLVNAGILDFKISQLKKTSQQPRIIYRGIEYKSQSSSKVKLEAVVKGDRVESILEKLTRAIQVSRDEVFITAIEEESAPPDTLEKPDDSPAESKPVVPSPKPSNRHFSTILCIQYTERRPLVFKIHEASQGKIVRLENNEVTLQCYIRGSLYIFYREHLESLSQNEKNQLCSHLEIDARQLKTPVSQ